VPLLEKLSSAVSWRSAIVALLVVSLLVPVIIPSGFFFPYVVPRNIFFRVIVEIGAVWLVLTLCFAQKTLDLRSEPILWALLAFLAAVSVSAVASPARMHSLFGDFERMGGVWAWLHLVLFFLLLRTLRDEDWDAVLNAALAVGLFVSLSAIVQHSEVVSAVQSANNVATASSWTLGNSGLLAAYLLMNIALAGYLATTTRRYWLLYLSAAGLNLLALVYSANRSTIVGFVLGAIVAGIIVATISTTPRKRWIALAMAATLAILVAGVSGGIREFPTSAVSRGAPAVLQRLALTNPAGPDESRTMQWRAAFEGFKDRPLFGYGLENHNLAWSAHFDAGIYGLDTDVYDRTHNQFLEMLATTGLIGTIAFLGIWVAIGLTLVMAYRAGRLSPSAVAVLSGVQIAYASYLFFWFFDLNSTMIWILIAALIASRGTVGSVVLEVTGHSAEKPTARPLLALVSILVLAAAVYGEAYVPLRANRALARIDAPSGSVAETLAQFEVLSNSRARQTAHTPLVMGQFIGSLQSTIKERRANPAERRILDRAFAETFAAFALEIHRDTLNDRLYTHQGALLLEAAQFYGSPSYRQQAIDAFHQAIELSPHRIQQRLLLASAQTGARDYERARVGLGDALKNDPQLAKFCASVRTSAWRDSVALGACGVFRRKL
jgi:O-antigen ligase